jgi:MFS family permease
MYAQYSLNNVGPRVAADLNGMALFGWFLALPGLSAAVATMIFGKLSDMYGRRIVLIIALVSFLIGSIMAAVSPIFLADSDHPGNSY